MSDWPEELSKSVHFRVPYEWLQDEVAPEEQCCLTFDETEDLLKLVSLEGSRIIDVMDPEDIIGGFVEVTDNEGDKGDTRPKTTLTLHAYPRRDPTHDIGEVLLSHCFSGIEYTHPKPHPNYKRPTGDGRKKYGHRIPFHRCFAVSNSCDKEHVEEFLDAILMVSGLEKNKNRGRSLVVINPGAGSKGNAPDVYESLVGVMLDQAKIQHDVCITKRPEYAKERMMKGFQDASEDNSKTVKDILEYTSIICMGGDGIIHEVLQGIHAREDSKQVLEKISFGFIGAGTSNGMSKSVAYESQELCSVMNDTFLIAKGHTKQADLSLYHTTSKSYFSFLTFSWGMLADIDIESEVLRSLGSLRFDLWAVWRVLTLRKYRAKFSYLPKQDAPPNIPALDQPLPTNANWVTMEDDFLLFWPSQVTHAAENVFNSPMSRLDDGVFQVFIVRAKGTSRWAVAKILLGLNKGDHVNMPNVEFIECSAYRLEAITPGSFNDLDGEVIEAGPIQGKVMPGTMKVYCK